MANNHYHYQPYPSPPPNWEWPRTSPRWKPTLSDHFSFSASAPSPTPAPPRPNPKGGGGAPEDWHPSRTPESQRPTREDDRVNQVDLTHGSPSNQIPLPLEFQPIHQHAEVVSSIPPPSATSLDTRPFFLTCYPFAPNLALLSRGLTSSSSDDHSTTRTVDWLPVSYDAAHRYVRVGCTHVHHSLIRHAYWEYVAPRWLSRLHSLYNRLTGKAT